jgi:hypothetical protein
MSDGRTVQELNQEVARKINEEARSNPQSPYANKYVGLANGQVVAVAEDFQEMDRLLRQAEPDPEKTLWLEASRDYDQIDEFLALLKGLPGVVRPKEGKALSDKYPVLKLNEELARKINEEARSNPHSPYANKFVGIANGKVVVVTEDFQEVGRSLRQAEPDPMKTFWLEASRDYDRVEEIWSIP